MKRSETSEVVVITGATAGVGRATVDEFARRGARIGLVARGKDRLDETARAVRKMGGDALPLSVDVADADAVDRAARAVETEFGPIDVWVNNAMTAVFAPVVKIAPDEFRRVTEVTYLGVVYGTMAALKRMTARDRGTIVQVGSALAVRSIPLQSAYCGAKHGIRGFTDSLRCELLHDESRVRLTMVHLPALNTPQFTWAKSRMPKRPQPVPPIYQPEVAGRAIYWAAHHDRREVYVGWSTAKAIWGQKMVPGVADHYLARNGYEAQQTDERSTRSHRDNLWEPVPGNFSAHGRFDDRAKVKRWEEWLSHHHTPSLLGAAVVSGVAALACAVIGWYATGD